MAPLAENLVKTQIKDKQDAVQQDIIHQEAGDQAHLASVLNDVDCIEIGTTNVCNRKCVSCPVGTSEIADKLTATSVSETHFNKILTNLSAFADKRFSLSLHEYNEPLKDKDILNKYLMAGRAFPKAELTLFTNGDLIHQTKKGFYALEQLFGVGIRHIRISIYDANPEKSKVFERLGIAKSAFNLYQNNIKKRTEFSHYRQFQGQEVLVRVLFLSTQKLGNRGGIIVTDKQQIRQGICSLPRRTLSIDYKGNLKMCCNVHHMEEGADTWMHGSLLESKIGDLLMSDTYAKMRHQTSIGDYSSLAKCQVCDFYQKSSDRLVGRMMKTSSEEVSA